MFDELFLSSLFRISGLAPLYPLCSGRSTARASRA